MPCVPLMTSFIHFRLADAVEEFEGGCISSPTLWGRVAAASGGNIPLEPGQLRRTAFSVIFPSIRRGAGRIPEQANPVTLYYGIRWRESVNKNTAALEDILPVTHLCRLTSADSAEIALETDMQRNGQNMLKVVHIKGNVWTLTVRGQTIDLGSLGVDSTFQATQHEMDKILRIATGIRLCSGKECTKDMSTEYISKTGNDNSTVPVIRSSKCLAVINWRDKNCCKKCSVRYKNVHSVLPKDDFKKETELLLKVFPNAPEDFKELLISQHTALTAKAPRSRRWSPNVISICQQLWSQSRKAYDAMKDNNMLILPTIRLLRMYKNRVPQNPGLNEQVCLLFILV